MRVVAGTGLMGLFVVRELTVSPAHIKVGLVHCDAAEAYGTDETDVFAPCPPQNYTPPWAGGRQSRQVKLGRVALENALEASILWKQEAQSTRGFATRHAKRHDSRRLHLVQSEKHALFTDLTTE